ncbi:MAG: ATP phosphoribosyltransferase regulatory subunit [Pseudomonadota bacterium]
MDERALNSGLLPQGLRDGLPPQAGHSDAVVRRLQDQFRSNGYDLVAPPLVEFEDALRGRLDAGQGDSDDAFRLLDPASQNPLVVRSDITRQVARIATTRMADEPRPLRLAYTGSALRTRGTQLQPSRQVRQVGLELIGSNAIAAVQELAEVISSTFDAFGLPDLTFDLATPGLIPALCRDLKVSSADAQSLKAALDDKDAAALAGLPDHVAEPMTAILMAIGPADKAVQSVNALALDGEAGALWRDAEETVKAFSAAVGADRVHLDPGEIHGFTYQAGWALSVFADGIRGELGRGGAYMLQGLSQKEPALGFTFYPDVFAAYVPHIEGGKRILVPHATAHSAITALQADGFITVRALETAADISAQAQQNRCTYVFIDGAAKAIG